MGRRWRCQDSRDVGASLDDARRGFARASSSDAPTTNHVDETAGTGVKFSNWVSRSNIDAGMIKSLVRSLAFSFTFPSLSIETAISCTRSVQKMLQFGERLSRSRVN